MAKSIGTPITLLNASAVAAASAGTKGVPGAAGVWTDISTWDGGDIGLSITNGATGPTLPGNILIQMSPDNGATVYDVWGFAGDTAGFVSSTEVGKNSATIKIDPGMKYVRVIGFGHSVNPVSYSATFTGVTRS